MRKAATDVAFEEAARLRDEIKRRRTLDLEFANEPLSPEGGSGGGEFDTGRGPGGGGGGGVVSAGGR